jgi:hypothetical protein
MGNVIGGQYKLHRFSLLDRDLGWGEGESLGMNVNHAGSFLRERKAGSGDNKAK